MTNQTNRAGRYPRPPVEASRVRRKVVAVIGAGISGLAAAKAFSERGHTVVGYERLGDLGGVWEPTRSYPDVQTQTPKGNYRYTDLAMPGYYPEWPKGPQVHAYLHAYADKHGLSGLFELEADVTGMERRADGKPGWTLTVVKLGESQRRDVDFVVMATGMFSNKNVIRHPGQESFVAQGGDVVHSSDYLDPAAARGKRVVVLGGAKSATDVAVNAANNGAAQVTWVYRHNVWRIPYYVGGVNLKYFASMRWLERQMVPWKQTPVQRCTQVLLKPLKLGLLKALGQVIVAQLGLRRWDMVPDGTFEDAFGCTVALVTPGLFEHLDAGTIRPIRATFDHYDGHNIIMTTGDRVKADVVVHAVGWELGMPILPDEYKEKLIEPDGQYKTYRLAVNPDVPDLGFVGFNSSFTTTLTSEVIANWLVRYMDGQLAEMPTEAQMRENMELMLDWRRHKRPASGAYGGLCSAPHHALHFDELLEDMGAAKTRRSNPLREQFLAPDPDAFAEFLASAPQYRAS